MKVLIGAKALASLKPKDKIYTLRDTNLKGFAIRIYPSGKSAYIVSYGRGNIITIADTSHLTPAQARQRAVQLLGDISKGDNPKEKQRKEKQEALSFSQFLDNDYKPWALANRKAGDSTISRLQRNFLPLLKDKKLKEITPWIVEKWRVEKGKKIKKSSMNRELTALKACLSKAVEWGKLAKNPLAGFKLQKVDNSPNVRFLTDNEEAKLRDALDARQEHLRADRDKSNQWRADRGYEPLPDLKDIEFVDHLKPLVILSLNTGCRRGEMFNLKWDDINFERKIMSIQGDGTKSGRTLHIPLNEEALNILWRWRKQSNGNALVFPGKGGQKLKNCDTLWRALLKEAGIDNFRWHDMRHSFASKLVMSGVDLLTVKELLGHRDYAMTLRYSHLGDDIKRQAVELLVKR